MSAAISKKTALERFNEAYNSAYYIRQESLTVTERLKEKVAEAARAMDDAKTVLESISPNDEAEKSNWEDYVEECNVWLEEVENNFRIWSQEWRRRNAIALCTAFEAFLRDFLIEQILGDPARLESFLLAKLHGTVKYSSNLQLSLSVTKSPLLEQDIDECLAVDYESFQDLQGKVSKAYSSLLGDAKKPFREGFRRSVAFQNDKVKSEIEREAAKNDIKLLFQIRHKLIHRSGQSDEKYRKFFRENSEIQERLKEADFPTSFSNGALTDLPEPDDILASGAVSPDFSDKIQEFAYSFQKYAEYIAETCRLK